MISFVRILLIMLLPIGLMVGPGRAICTVGDIDGDCKVGTEDLHIFRDWWLVPVERPVNLNGDEEVGMANFALLAENWQQAGIPLVINEVMASNNTVITDPQGEYDDWIEIYNAGNGSIDIGGMYLTDDLEDPTKWRIPDNVPALTAISPKGFILIWADNDTDQSGLHASFELSATGEELGLFDTDGTTLIDSIIFDEQSADISYGRYPDGTDNWRYMVLTTPGSKNISIYQGIVEEPKFSKERGFYDEPFYVTLNCETEGATIYYTLDYSEPYSAEHSESISAVYTEPIHITKTTCLRALAYKYGWMSSKVVTSSYIFLDDVMNQPQYPEGFPRRWGQTRVDYEMDPDVVNNPAYTPTIKEDLKTIPSVSIVINNDDFFGAQKGIYANTQASGIAWERPASIEWIDPVKGGDFQVNAGLRVHGSQYGRTSGVAKHSLRMLFKNEYGPPELEFPLFEDTDVDRFDSLVLRGIWNYSWFGDSTACGGLGTDHADYLRDQFARDTVRDMDGLASHSRAVHVYINGLYWGLYILTERPDDGFASIHIGGEKEDYDVLKAPNSGSTMDIIAGDRSGWNTLFSMAEQNLSSTAAYESIQQYLDIPAMIDYLLMVYYVGSRDAPVLLCSDYSPRNFYALRRREPAGPYLFMAWDVEWILESPNVNRLNVVGIQNPYYLLNRLRSNEECRILLADHIHRHFFNDGALTSAHSIERYMTRANKIDRAIVGESARWGDSKRSYRPYTRDVEWVAEIDRLVDQYFSVRTDIVLEQFRQAGFYPNVLAPEFFVNGHLQHGGYISSNDSFSITSSSGTVWYTLDASDPRLPGTTPEEGQSYTLVAEDDPKLILVPTGPVDDAWKSDWTFNISQWTVGTGGVGYERSSGYEGLIDTDVGDMMYNRALGCYIRIPFTVDADISSFNTLTLKMQYDDGFVAYLNGTEVKRTLVSGIPAWNSMADGNHEAQGFESFNISEHLDALKQGQNILAIHGLNVSYTSSDFIISCELVAGEGSPATASGASPTAIRYTEPISLNKSTHVKARTLSGSTWSALNEAVFAVGPVKENLRISEIMYNPQDMGNPDDPDTEFIELTNIGTETINLNLVRFTNGVDFTFPGIELTPGQYVLVVKDTSAFEAKYDGNYNIAGQYTGSLNNAGERVELQDAAGQTIHNFRYGDGWYDITDGLGFSLTVKDPANTDPNSLSDKGNWRPSATVGGSPGEDDTGEVPELGSVVINEILAHSHEGGPDWIELHNTTGYRINIGGWFLSDDDSDFRKYQIADGTSIGPHGYIVFYEDEHFGNINDPGCNTPFALSENGETLYLHSGFAGELTGYSEQERFGASETAVAFGRYRKSTGTYNFVAMSENTPGESNAYPKVGPIIINEIMYHPPEERDAEYVELLNIGDYPVVLYDFVNNEPWRFTDDPDDPGIEFLFPSEREVTIEPGEYLLLVKDLDVFVGTYLVPVDIQVFAWGAGRLANGSEKIQLSKPGDVDGEGIRQWIRVDRVVYSDGSHHDDFSSGVDPWPVEADGGGGSLSRLEPADYGNDIINWQAADPSPGSANP